MCTDKQVSVKQVATYFGKLKTRDVLSAAIIFTIIFSLLGFFVSPVVADNYQFQLDGTYENMRFHDDESKHYKIAATYYLSGVDDGVGPLSKV